MRLKKSTVKLVFGAFLLVFSLIGIFFVVTWQKGNTVLAQSEQNGTQIITIDTKGGYYPNNVIAKANIPTIIRFKTDNTYDCSAALYIKDLNVSQVLPPTGQTDIKVEAQAAGKQITGSCSMGMYGFRVTFM